MAHGTVADASSAAGGGTVPSDVSALSISSKQLASKKERQKCPSTQITPGIAREEARRIGATGRCRAGFFFLVSTHLFHGIDVRPLMLGATCHIASASDGAPCKRL